MENKIIWLASYPKSGNTWFRTFITALTNNGEVSINKLHKTGMFSNKSMLENTLDLCTDDLTAIEFDQYRKLAYCHLATTEKTELFIKIHDAYTYSNWDRLPLVPSYGTRVAIYLIRNPLDVVLSMSNYNSKSIQDSIDKMINYEEGSIAKKSNGDDQFYQLLGNWSMHVSSWVYQNEIPVHVIRYEDMKLNPLHTFRDAVEKMQLNSTLEEIENAIDACKFEKLKQQEEKMGFNENLNKSSTFFYKGEIDRWKKELNEKQILQVMAMHEKVMKQYNYWEEAVLFLNHM